MTVPDLKNGYMIFNYDAPNQWQTPILSALKKTENGKDSFAYMGNECRNESITGDIEEGMIRGHTDNYEVRTLRSWDRMFIWRERTLHLARPFGGNGKTKLAKLEPFDRMYKISCAMLEVEEMPFKSTLAFLQDEADTPDRSLYMSIEWPSGGVNYTSYAPCRYVNYPPVSSGKKYVQPQSGQVLFYDNGEFFISYAVANVSGESCNVEFCVRKPMPLYNFWKRPKGYVMWPTVKRGIIDPFLWLISRPFIINGFGPVVDVKGTVKFFRIK